MLAPAAPTLSVEDGQTVEAGDISPRASRERPPRPATSLGGLSARGRTVRGAYAEGDVSGHRQDFGEGGSNFVPRIPGHSARSRSFPRKVIRWNT